MNNAFRFPDDITIVEHDECSDEENCNDGDREATMYVPVICMNAALIYFVVCAL